MPESNPNSESPIIILSSDDDLMIIEDEKAKVMPGSTDPSTSSFVTQVNQHKKKTKDTLFIAGTDCFICKKSGHRPKYCPDKSSWGTQSTKICLNCGDVGHEMFSCKNMYSPDDLKEVQCYVCKCFGHLCCVNYADEVSTEVSCYRCGQLGHSGWECAKVHAETGSEWTPSSCEVCRQESHTACKCIARHKKVKRIKDPSIPETEKEKEKKQRKKLKRMRKKMEKKNEKDPVGKCGNDLGVRSMPPQPNPKGRGSSITERPPAYNHNYNHIHNYNHGWGYPMYLSNNRYQFNGGSGYNSGFHSNPGMFYAAGYNGYQHRFSASGSGTSSSYGRGS